MAASQSTAQDAAAAAKQGQDAMTRATRAIQAMQGLQNAARSAAQASQRSVTLPQVAVPNGLAPGGLQAAQGWQGANAPTQVIDATGQTQVGIRQTRAQAILTWNSFNVGARTTLTFDQQGNANWVALNRVVGSTAPSQILGNIKADGSVYVINQNGIIFGGASQVNVGSLIASSASITDTQFLTNGIYAQQASGQYVPSFTGARGASHGRGWRADLDQRAVVGDAGRRLRPADGHRGQQCRLDQRAAGPGATCRRQRFSATAGLQHRRQPGLDHARQRRSRRSCATRSRRSAIPA